MISPSKTGSCSTSPYHHITISPFHNFTVSPFHHFTIFCVIISPFHRFTIIIFHYYIITSLHHSNMKSYNHFMISLLHHFTIKPLQYCMISLRVGWMLSQIKHLQDDSSYVSSSEFECFGQWHWNSAYLQESCYQYQGHIYPLFFFRIIATLYPSTPMQFGRYYWWHFAPLWHR